MEQFHDFSELQLFESAGNYALLRDSNTEELITFSILSLSRLKESGEEGCFYRIGLSVERCFYFGGGAV